MPRRGKRPGGGAPCDKLGSVNILFTIVAVMMRRFGIPEAGRGRAGTMAGDCISDVFNGLAADPGQARAAGGIRAGHGRVAAGPAGDSGGGAGGGGKMTPRRHNGGAARVPAFATANSGMRTHSGMRTR